MSVSVERCRDCGKTWAVIVTPRPSVQCGDCARPKPNYRAAAYWHLRAWTGWPTELYRSPEWWDQQTSLADMKYAAAVAVAWSD
jgi:hypothetical protein